ncbi:hypothetical protein [Paenibacillus sp. 32352]|uniref:hypothetical protein n=1 Tax=Paenibacillus sp. 32352 TaxID=1969111 RepID=UPI00117CBB8B|nr:hypothetical protein [Paenibacillus sp. 32352]
MKETYKSEFLVFFRYFIECYFIPSISFVEVINVVREYKRAEDEEHIQGLLRESTVLFEKEEWDFVQEFVKTHGMRSLSNEKPKKLIELIIQELSL